MFLAGKLFFSCICNNKQICSSGMCKHNFINIVKLGGFSEMYMKCQFFFFGGGGVRSSVSHDLNLLGSHNLACLFLFKA